MRLHSLRITAFGPFSQTQSIDFDDLAGSGLFLVNGATGAGKTTVLDALCFALFADVPGARSARGLRSDLADATTATSVTLDFTASGRRLRVTRSPEQVRPKRRGTGTVKAPASVALEELTGGTWSVRSTRIDEAAEVIADAVGLGLAQFQRIALLPQGEFAAFLRADARERHRLLTALFDVSAFEDVEAWLADQRREHALSLAEAERDLGYRVRALAELLSALPAECLDLPMPALTEISPCEWAEVTPVITTGLRVGAVAAEAALIAARDADDEAHRAAAQADLTSAIRHRGELALSRVRQLQQEDSAIAVARGRLDAGTRAERVRPHLHTLDLAQAELDRADRRLSEAGRTLDAQGGGLDVTALPPSDALHAGTRDLAAGEPAARSLATAAADAAQAADGVALAQQDVDRLMSQQQRRRELIARLRTQVAGLDAEREAVSHRRVSRDLLRQAHVTAQAAARTHGEHEDAVREKFAAQQAEVVAQSLLLRLERAKVADLAAYLAQELEDGSACPVCGSPEHPRPATVGGDWSPAQISEAERSLEAASAAVRASQLRLAALDERLASIAARLIDLGHPDTTLDQLAAAESAADAELAAAVRHTETLLAQSIRLTEQEEEEKLSGALLHTATTALELCVAAEDSGRERAENARRAVVAALAAHADCPCTPPAQSLPGEAGNASCERPGDEGEVADPAVDPAGLHDPGIGHTEPDAELAARLARERTRHDAIVRAVHDARSGAERRAAAWESRERAQGDLDQALPETGFADAAAARAALLPEGERESMAQRIASHERDAALSEATLAEPEVQQALSRPAPDLAALSALAASRRAQAQIAARQAHEIERIASATGSLLAGIEMAAATVQQRQVAHLRIGALAELTNGTSPENTLRMRLSTFVLAARLERVVELANERLAVMGEGRFRLGHDDSPAAHGARSGLGLLIRDEWSGTDRSPASLSGGESFMASVALALGLADALRESGAGVELQTLFIDEGFGGLDEHSLEDVMAVLDSLRDGGRAVGVISHLAELRDRIPAQLTVHKSSSGSSLTQTSGYSASA